MNAKPSILLILEVAKTKHMRNKILFSSSFF